MSNLRQTSNRMRLLVLTQAVDRNDTVLGFFHGWLSELSKHFERIHVICLKEGKHDLPQNVTVYSLGKGKATASFQISAFRKIQYALRFYRYAWILRHEYDAVLVHMNQEYVLLAGLFWRLTGKRIYLWRNHYAGSLMTTLAVALSTKVFCTSRFSYTAKFRKTILMPVGIDTNVFRPQNQPRKAGSILSLGRIAPSKRIEVLIEALAALARKRVNVEAHIFGDPLPKDIDYRARLLKRVDELGLNTVQFHSGVPNGETPKIYGAYDIFVNCSGSGMYDKTIFEAAACGCIVLASSRDFGELAGKQFEFSGEESDLSKRLGELLSMSESDKEKARSTLMGVIQKHSLAQLGKRLAVEMQ